jgi:hypothetical protein
MVDEEMPPEEERAPPDEEQAPADLYKLFVRIADEEDTSVYVIEYVFVRQPSDETLVMLFEQAKHMFSVLYQEAEAVDFSVEVRLRSHYQ